MYLVNPHLHTSILFGLLAINASQATADLPIHVGEFSQQEHRGYSSADGLVDLAISQLNIGSRGALFAKSDSGTVWLLEGDVWVSADDRTARVNPFESLPWYPSLEPLVGSSAAVRDVAKHAGQIAVATENGLYVGDGARWELALPKQGNIRWAPIDVRAVTYDHSGQLWFASPQGVGFRVSEQEWRLFNVADGLPYNDFTCIAAGPKGIWFGTTNGAIHYEEGRWAFRQGRRWLLDNNVRDIVVDEDGTAWFATSRGVSRIAVRPMTLATKAAFYGEELEKYHRRTSLGYISPARLASPGDKSTTVPVFTDNDGFNTGLYLAAVSFGYGVTQDTRFRELAENAFRALAFLSEVTQGGQHPAPEGFIARNVIPTSDADPNQQYDLAYDLRRNRADTLWKIIQPRLPIDKSGKWYWKCDSSSDELDGHFFAYAIYFDHACANEQQKDEVRNVVRRIMDHILAHNYSLVDHDGLPTRWARFSPDDLNRNPAWCAERGLNSYSILTYLTIAHHITGDPKYRQAYLELALDQGYGMNGMTQPKWLAGPNSPGHQPDDNMAFMNYYHLIRYETDNTLLSMYQYAIRSHWQYERFEANAFTNFVYGACSLGKTRRDQWGEVNLSPPANCFADAVDTLKRYPLDLVEWPMSNAHRTDMVPFEGHGEARDRMGRRIDGYAFPIDERHETYWDWDPWRLTSTADGLVLRPGFHYLLAYYMAQFHGFIDD